MLYTIAVVLIILWLLGLVSAYTMGGFIHILLVIALIAIVINVIQGAQAAMKRTIAGWRHVPPLPKGPKTGRVSFPAAKPVKPRPPATDKAGEAWESEGGHVTKTAQ